MKILSLDYGTKRVGLATCDALEITVNPKGFFENNKDLFEKLKQFIQQEQIQKVILGLPLSMDGSSSAMTHEVKLFHQNLSAYLNVPIEFWDERLTSHEAQKILIDQNVRRQKRKTLVDGLAACLLLEDYLGSKKSR